MRKLLFIFFLLPLFADAQVWQQNNLEYGHQFKGLKTTRALLIPKVQTTVQWGRDTGAVYYSMADSSIYVWTGYQWRELGGGSSYTFSNGVKESAGTVTAGGSFEADSISYVSNSSKLFRIQSRASSSSNQRIDVQYKHNELLQQLFDNSPLKYSRLYFQPSTITLETADDITGVSGGVVTEYGQSRLFGKDGSSGRALWVNKDSATVGSFDLTSPIITFRPDSTVAYKKIVYKHYDSSGYTDNTLVPKIYVQQRLASKLSNITGLVTAGTGISVTGSGTSVSPYVVNANAEGVTWGTYAQRVAISSPTTGQRFYQTDERIGPWIYDGSQWIHSPPTSAMIQSSQWFPGALTTSTSGAGAGGGYGTQGASFKMSGGFAYVATGTTTTGSAVTYATRTTVPNTSMPGDSASNGFKVVLVGKVALFNAPSASEDFRLNFGTRNAFSSLYNDSTGYGYVFSIANYRNSSFIECYTSGRSPELITTTTSVPITDAVFPQVSGYPNDISTASEGFITFVLVYNTKHCDYYINGTLVASHTLTGSRANQQGANDWIFSIVKRSGTTSRLAAIESLYSYYIKDNF